jgi:hypothetical protein
MPSRQPEPTQISSESESESETEESEDLSSSELSGLDSDNLPNQPSGPEADAYIDKMKKKGKRTIEDTLSARESCYTHIFFCSLIIMYLQHLLPKQAHQSRKKPNPILLNVDLGALVKL